MNEKQKLTIAIVLSVVILVGWNYFFPPAKPAATSQTSSMGSDKQEGPQPIVPLEAQTRTTHPSSPLPVTAKALLTRTQGDTQNDTQRVMIKTSSVTGSINLKGARIDDLKLLRYRESLESDSPLVSIFRPAGTVDPYFAQIGWNGRGAPPADALWNADGTTLTLERPVTLDWTNDTGQRFEIEMSIDKNYMFSVRQRVINTGTAPVQVYSYALINRAGAASQPSSWNNHIGPLGVFDGVLNNVDADDIDDAKGKELSFTSRGGWIGFSDKYWLTALAPDQKSSIDANFRADGSGNYQADFASGAKNIAPGETSVTTLHVFAGAKEVKILDYYQDKVGIPQFDKAIDWGWFYFLAKPFFYVLAWLDQVVGNYGFAIIFLTMIVRVCLFPIANKQFSSMARMRLLSPKLKALQERHKEDKSRLQKEMMSLYREEKVNPLGGCLPIFLQIPVFYALYKVLFLTIELRQQPFIGWIHDLSAPDPLTPVNLFGLLPFTPPAFLALGILPILLGLTMWLQQKLNPTPMDEIQAKVFALMPWAFMFIMAPFAAGLQLYWTTNNLLSIAQQWWLYRRYNMNESTKDKKPAREKKKSKP